MTDSFREQLLNLGFKAAPRPERKPGGKGGHGGPRKEGAPGGGPAKDGSPRGAHRGGPAHDGARGGRHPGEGKSGASGKQGRAAPRAAHAQDGARRKAEMDLGKAWALRAQQEKHERIEAERIKQEEARQRREARAKLEELLQGRAFNDAAAEIARHFEYGGKIKRIYVTEAQLKALNAGALGVVQLNGRYLLVDAAVLAQAAAVFPPAVALKVDPDAPAQDDPYADPRYQVPDDLVW
ncbi:nucleoprotein/polynucleotide-associated enzyme [Pseudoxanthomonas broegbernensis]|uniref:Nucleoprotein/polynucleotide-associated enzyme n=1 Tax=Pseudoxanthomonas broegbernensis TaxID=83619 RepID=A0A7V8GPF8_9GAMM|nr:DUF2058 family protein [Pseudoxanthomonas broegbernensis]KAF1687642.1 nucleoprotein/polynucleotide-associated enzyme [Pseudoxanthomonas broegbernensis]MBB6064668.1 uncharacterized protein YaiL (DUF2058 family) [Pseudoxanthomonas broegbernensis]